MNIGAFNQIANAEDACSSGSTLIWVFPGDALTAGHQAEAIRRLADALGMDHRPGIRGRGVRLRPRPADPSSGGMMDEARSESRPFGAVIVYDRRRFAAGAADPTKYVRELRDAGVELLCVWDNPPRNAARIRDPAIRRQNG